MSLETNWNKLKKLLKSPLILQRTFSVSYLVLFSLALVFFAVNAKSQYLWEDSKSVSDSELNLKQFDPSWDQDDLIVLKNSKSQVIGLFEVQEKSRRVLKLLSMRSDNLPQAKDSFQEFDLQGESEPFKGTAFLWKYSRLGKKDRDLFKPLYTQGMIIGETAQTLQKGEKLLSVLGDFAFGVHPAVSVSTSFSGFLIGSANLKIKTRAYQGEHQTFAVGIRAAQDNKSSEKLMNIEFLWDSILSDTLVAHSSLSAAVISFDEADEVAALKSYGSSSIQTGYEILLSNWSRILVGPSFNVESNAFGGYLGFVKIYDDLHLQLSLTSNNIRELKYSTKEGYLVFVEAYWRW